MSRVPQSLELEVDVPQPGGVAPGVGSLLDFAWQCSKGNRQTLSSLHPGSTPACTVRHGWQPKLPVFTVEWEQTVTSTVEAFVDLNMRMMAERASEWDTTFLGADYLEEHGSSTTLHQYSRLVRWRFRAAPLQDREMLYIVVPYRPAGVADGPLMIAYISVKGPRYPVAAGYARARNLVPSFDLCELGDGATLRVQHCMTTEIGGGVAYWVWNRVFKSAVLTQNVVEAAHVRDTLQANHGGASGASKGKRRVVIAGFGDSGLTTAVHLASHSDIEILAISPTTCHYSAQELGGRLAQPALWQRIYLLPFKTYRRLDGVRIVQGLLTGVDADRQTVRVRTPSGEELDEPYDALLIATGVTNGFWRRPPCFRTVGDIEASLHDEQAVLAAARTIAVVGGGPSGVSAAYNLGVRYPRKAVHCFMSGDRVLPGYHPRTIERIEAKLTACGVVLHPRHRAHLPASTDALGRGPVEWASGQPAFEADVVVWAVGAVQPNSDALPKEMLTAAGFVAVDEFLRVRRLSDNGVHPNVFAVGDIADTDPRRTSARNDGWSLVGRNISAYLANTPERMAPYVPPTYRWGSILGPWDGLGYEVHFQNGMLMWLPERVWSSCFWPLVQRFLWAGMRNSVDWTSRVVEEGEEGVVARPA